MKRKAYLVCIASLIVFTLGLLQINSVSAYSYGKFGSTPYSDVYSAAGNSYSGSGLTQKALTAMMLAVTWGETTGDDITKTPSPMTLGRADGTYANLWSFANHSTTYKYVRAHWNPGAGIFQLDSAGLGADIGLKEAIYTNTAAAIVAAKIASVYKSSTATTAAGKRAAAWKSWYACSDGSCETIFNKIYNSSTDTLYITTDTTVTRSGGLLTKTCGYQNIQVTFTCYKYDVDNAQGHTGSFYYPSYVGNSSSLEPVPLPFYTFISGSAEYRFWSSDDTGYDATIYKFRNLGTNARTNSYWFTNDYFYGN